MFRGETLDTPSSKLGFTSGQFAERRDEALAGTPHGVRSLAPSRRDGFNGGGISKSSNRRRYTTHVGLGPFPSCHS